MEMDKANEEWSVLTSVSQPDEAHLIGGLLTSAGIAVKMERDVAGAIYGLTIGPLADIVILVPAGQRSAAEKVLEAIRTESPDEEGTF